MPIYEYECEKCGCVDEVIQKFSEQPLTRCRHCDGKLHKLISHSAFHLKGTGWYVTDYAGKKGGGTQTAAGGDDGAPKSESTSTAAVGKQKDSKND